MTAMPKRPRRPSAWRNPDPARECCAASAPAATQLSTSLSCRNAGGSTLPELRSAQAPQGGVGGVRLGPDTDLDVDGDGTVGRDDQWIDVHFAQLWYLFGKAGDPQQYVLDRAKVARRGAAEARQDSARRVWRSDQLGGVDVGQWNEPIGPVGEEVGEDTAEAEPDERPEGGVLHDADQRLDTRLGGR